MSEGQQVLCVFLAVFGGLCMGALIVTLAIMQAHRNELDRLRKSKDRYE